ncbi:non-structural maintenance of chromosomes element 4 homolog A isoform X2 [Athalia rosae]|nr:non-structural maintenance of chromosomes element 4 homolog A isoform X2 [Athalia rosae]
MVNTDTITADENDAEKVNHTEEILLDSEVMSVSSDVLNRCSEALNKDMSPYDHTEFAEKILSHLELRSDTMMDKPHWPSLSDDLLLCLNLNPRYSFLLGALEPLEKKQVVRKKPGPREAQAATKRPEKVHAVDKVEDDVEQTVQKIKALVSKYYRHNDVPLDFFKLTLNPDDFGRTVENILHVAFLVRDGYFTLVKDNEGRLIIQSTPKDALAKIKKGNNETNVQNVMAISVQQWKILKGIYQIQKPMIDFNDPARS